MLHVTFRSRGPARREHHAIFDLGTAAANANCAVRIAHTHNSEIIASRDDSESASYGVRCATCGEWETACRCED